jgi:hypothetical protein
LPFPLEEIESGAGKTTGVVFARSDSDPDNPVNEAEAYLVPRGKVVFSQLVGSIGSTPNVTELKDVHLIRGFDYVVQLSQHRLQGHRKLRDQALVQPRHGQFVDNILIPADIIAEIWLNAGWEAAELSAAGQPLFDVIDEDQDLKRKQLALGFEKEWFQSTGGRTSVIRYHAVEQVLEPLLEPFGHLERG